MILCMPMRFKLVISLKKILCLKLQLVNCLTEYFNWIIIILKCKGIWRHSVRGLKRSMCGVMKLKNLILAKGKEYDNISGLGLGFSLRICWISAHWRLHSGSFCIRHVYIVITHPVPNAASNYKLRVLMHTGMKQNTFKLHNK